MRIVRTVAIALAVILPVSTGAAQEKVRVAVFDFELIDTSLGGGTTGSSAAETARLERLGEQLRDAIASAEGFTVVDIAPVAPQARARNLQQCGGCDVVLARELGADWSVTGTVQKVSNLILNINIFVRDVGTKELTQAMSADIRGNTDESWQRGLSWLVRNRLTLSE